LIEAAGRRTSHGSHINLTKPSFRRLGCLARLAEDVI
jgi:hypothetical protein